MGCGMSSEDKEGKQRNEEIENQLKRDKLSLRNEIKVLLLGMLCDLCDSSFSYLANTELIRGTPRGRRVWKVDHFETNETHPRRWLLAR